MPYTYLPGVDTSINDGNTHVREVNTNPVVIVLGTAGKGPSEQPWIVDNVTASAKTFGLYGSVARGLMETYGWGAKNFRAYRYGGTACSLEGIGVSSVGTATLDSGIYLTSTQKDATALEDYRLAWNGTTKELWVWNDGGALVYNRNFLNQSSAAVDVGAVTVGGTYGANTANLGTVQSGVEPVASSGVLLTDYVEDPHDPDTAPVYYAGADGVNDGTTDSAPSFMEKYEALHKAYALLENEELDYVVPMEVFLDVPNYADDTTVFSAYSWTAATSTSYPTAGAPEDALGKLYVQEYLGEFYFWWDTDGDGQAELYPSVGSSSATTNASGTTLTAADFREVNFAHQLAEFCYTHTQDTHWCVGMIGVMPPAGWSAAAIQAWVGTAPTYTLDSNRNWYVAISSNDGTGLLGNKFMAGKYGYRSGAGYGGFAHTSDGYPTQSGNTELTDDNDHVIDIGKHIAVVAGYGNLNTPWDTSGNGYATSMAAPLAGFESALGTGSACTNKPAQVRMPFQLNKTKLDALSRFRYVMVGKRTKGNVWVDGPTGARPDSDYQRLSTVRTIKRVVNDIREIADPYLGEAGSTVARASLKTNIEAVISRYTGNGLQGGIVNVTATKIEQIRGEAQVELVLVPEFELRQIHITVSLAPSL